MSAVGQRQEEGGGVGGGGAGARMLKNRGAWVVWEETLAATVLLPVAISRFWSQGRRWWLEAGVHFYQGYKAPRGTQVTPRTPTAAAFDLFCAQPSWIFFSKGLELQTSVPTTAAGDEVMASGIGIIMPRTALFFQSGSRQR